MEFGDQLAQLVAVIVVLLGAYVGVKFWTKRSGKSEGGRILGGGGSLGGGGFTAGDAVEDMDVSLGDAASSHSGSGDKKDRFNLTGRDAEVAAKVLKRMLKQDREGDKAG